jgi:AcrR family transcriptional regulator
MADKADNRDPRHAGAPTRRTQAERRASTRAALLRAGRQLFTEHGYAGAGREDIVAVAGVTRGALYHHFGDKLGLFRAVVEELEAELTEQVAATADFEGDARNALLVGCQAFLDGALDPAVRRILVLEAPAVLGWQEWRELEGRYGLGLTKMALEMAMDSGSIERQPVDPLAHLLLAALAEAAMMIAQADDPAAARDEIGNTVERLISRL